MIEGAALAIRDAGNKRVAPKLILANKKANF